MSPPFHFSVRYVRFLLLMGCDRFPNLGDGPRAPRHTPNQPEQSREFGRRRWSGLGGPWVPGTVLGLHSACPMSPATPSECFHHGHSGGVDCLGDAVAALVIEHVGAGRHLDEGVEGFHDGTLDPDPRHVDASQVVAVRIGHVVTSM
jgi:hypothetical protein